MDVTNNIHLSVRYSQSPKTDTIDVNKVMKPLDPERAKDYKIVKFDRYEGVPADDGALKLNGNSNSIPKGIFSENTSADVGERVIKDLELSDGYTPGGFSAKHIVSAFFRAEGASRYHVGLNYEIAELAKTEAWAIDHGQVNLSWATENGSFNEDSVATIAAQVGKYIDSCHENGTYSDEEYAQLNDEITNCTKYWLDSITDARGKTSPRRGRANVLQSACFVQGTKKNRRGLFIRGNSYAQED